MTNENHQSKTVIMSDSDTTTTSSSTTGNSLESIRYAYGTDVGKRREENQDSLGVVETNDTKFFIVADGMGGVKGGAIASNLAVTALREVLESKGQLTEVEICEALGEANTRIFEKGMEDPALAGMGTTFVGLGFVDTTMYISSVGDSRAYRVRGNTIEQLTEDHTLVMELLRSGAISPEQAGNHPVSHMLTRSLGPTPSVEVDCWKCVDGPAAGDIYLLCSDGLYNLVGSEEFLDILQSSSLDEAVQELIDLANLRGGTDNITVMLIKVDETFAVPASRYATPVEAEVLGAPEENLHSATANGHASSAIDPRSESSTHSTVAGPNSNVTADGSGVLVDSKQFGEPTGAVKSTSAAVLGDAKLESKVSLEGVKARQRSGEQTRASARKSSKGSKAAAAATSTAVQTDSTALQDSKPSQPHSEVTVAEASIKNKDAAAKVVEPIKLENVIDPAKKARGEAVTEALQKPKVRTELFTGRTGLLVALLIAVAFGYFGGIFVGRINGNRDRIERAAVAPAPLAAEVAKLDNKTSQYLGRQQASNSPELIAPASENRVASTVAAARYAGEGLAGGNYHGLPQEEVARIVRRKQVLRDSIVELETKISSFDKPFSGRPGELLAEASKKQEELKTELDQIRSEIDVATRKLSVWFGRRKRLQTADIVNLSTEVAVSSPTVQDKQEAFNRATWAYLKEAEALRYNPRDQNQDSKVDELIRARKERMQELFEEVRRAIDKEVAESDRAITELTLKRDRIDVELELLRRNVEYVRVLTSGDAQARSAKKRELVRDREISVAELEELDHLLAEADEGLGGQAMQ